MFSYTTWMTLVGAIIVAVAAALADRRRSATNERLETLMTKNAALAEENRDLAQKNAANDAEKTELMRKIVATHGTDKELLRRIIDANTTTLMAHRRTGERLLDDVIAQLPATKNTFEKQNQDRATAFEKFDAEFRYAWEPLMRFALKKFDQGCDELQQRGVSVQVTKNDDFPLVIGQNVPGTYQVRTVQAGSCRISVYINPALHLDKYTSDLLIDFQILDKDGRQIPAKFQLWVTGNDGRVISGDTGISTNGKPAEGRPSAEVVNAIEGGLAKFFEQLLLHSGFTPR